MTPRKSQQECPASSKIKLRSPEIEINMFRPIKPNWIRYLVSTYCFCSGQICARANFVRFLKVFRLLTSIMTRFSKTIDSLSRYKCCDLRNWSQSSRIK